MAARQSVVLLDYGSGNVHSAAKALERAGANVELTADRQRVMDADGLVVPGVGAFAAVMAALNEVRGGAPYGATTIAHSDGSRQPDEDELEGARYQGRRIAETAIKLHG